MKPVGSLKTAAFAVLLTNTQVGKNKTCGKINANTVSWLHYLQQLRYE